jgi:hypothetical protein
MASIISAGTTSGTAINISGDTSGQLQLQTNGSTTAVTIDASQRVGIGTTSPSYKLEVYEPSTAGLDGLKLSNTEGSFVIRVNDDNAFLQANNTVFRNTAETERMRLNSSGNLLWGCTAVSGGVPTTTGIAFGAAPGTYCNSLTFRNGADPTYVNDYYNAAGTRQGLISVNASGTSFTTSSDYRLKTNITPMTGALEKVAQLKPVNYTWIADNSPGQGFIAHELQEIVPQCVVGNKDAVDSNGNPEYQGVDTSFLVATLTAAIQELNAKVIALEAKVGI